MLTVKQLMSLAMVQNIPTFAHGLRQDINRWRGDLERARACGDVITADLIQRWIVGSQELLGNLVR